MRLSNNCGLPRSSGPVGMLLAVWACQRERVRMRRLIVRRAISRLCLLSDRVGRILPRPAPESRCTCLLQSGFTVDNRPSSALPSLCRRFCLLNAQTHRTHLSSRPLRVPMTSGSRHDGLEPSCHMRSTLVSRTSPTSSPLLPEISTKRVAPPPSVMSLSGPCACWARRPARRRSRWRRCLRSARCPPVAVQGPTRLFSVDTDDGLRQAVATAWWSRLSSSREVALPVRRLVELDGADLTSMPST